jgi:hypothetical protein
MIIHGGRGSTGLNVDRIPLIVASHLLLRPLDSSMGIVQCIGSIPHDVIQHRQPTADQLFPFSVGFGIWSALYDQANQCGHS